MSVVDTLRSKFFPNYQGVRQQFIQTVHVHLRPGYRVLNAGCGKDSSLQLKGKCKEVLGIDKEKSIFENKDIDTPIIGDLESLPLSANTLDMVIYRFVVEHLENPQVCFGELSRVLKDGGLAFVLTPNLLHYTSQVTRLASLKLQKYYCRKMGWEPEAVFPTYYRANRRQKLCAVMHRAGFRTLYVAMVSGGPPEYLSFSPITFLAGIAYDRIVNRFNFFQDLRCSILGVFQKRGKT